MMTRDGTVRSRSGAGWLRWSLALALTVVAAVGLGWGYWSAVRHRLATISVGRLYQSADMPLDDLAVVAQEKHLRSVIDLRAPLEPGPTPSSEGELLRGLGVRYFSLPSEQLPDAATVDRFLAIASDAGNFPMLVHCYHGEGRSVLFAAFYRIEFEGWDNERARSATKLLSFQGAFGPHGSKGKLLLAFRPHLTTATTTHQPS